MSDQEPVPVNGSEVTSDVIMIDAHQSKSDTKVAEPAPDPLLNPTHTSVRSTQPASHVLSTSTPPKVNTDVIPEDAKQVDVVIKAQAIPNQPEALGPIGESIRKNPVTTTFSASSASHSPMTGVQNTSTNPQPDSQLAQASQPHYASAVPKTPEVSGPLSTVQIPNPSNVTTQQSPSVPTLLTTTKLSAELSTVKGGLESSMKTNLSEPAREGVRANNSTNTNTSTTQANTPIVAAVNNNPSATPSNVAQAQNVVTTTSRPASLVTSNPTQAATPTYKLSSHATPTPGAGTASNVYSITNAARTTAGTFLPVANRTATTAGIPATTIMRPMTTPAAQAQAQYNLALQARAAALAAQGQTGHPQQQYIRTQPVSSTPRPPTYVKPESQTLSSHTGLEPMKLDGASKDVIDEAESERTRLENRERKKRWREANEDRNKDNDLRCRVNKRAHKLYGKEPSKAKDLWIEEEFSKRKSKRQEKEGKGPDGNLLIEGTDLASLNHFEMNSVIMSTLSEFVTNPAAPALKDNADLNSLLHKLRNEPQVIRALFTGQPKPNSVPPPTSAFSSNALTSDNVHKMDYENGQRQTSSAPDDDEDEDDKFSQNGSITNSVVDMTAGTKATPAANADAKDLAGTATVNAVTQASVTESPAARRFSTSSNDGTSQHLTYGIGSGFEPQVALALSSELFRLISMQPEAGKTKVSGEVTKAPIPSTTSSTVQLPKSLAANPSPAIETSVKQEIQT